MFGAGNVQSRYLEKRKRIARMIRNYQLYLLLLPAVVYFLVFRYIPMYGLQIAFKEYYPNKGFLWSPWVGLEHFQRFFRSSDIWMILTNTLTINVYNVLIGFPFPILLALMINNVSKLRIKKIIQTTVYAPYFISTVVLVGMIQIFLSPRSGIINHLVTLLGFKPVFFMAKPELFKNIYILTDIWQNSGWNSIVYIAALASISIELHEAGIVDGASRLQRIWHIDLPGIMPTAVVLLTLSCGRLLTLGFEKIYLMQNDLNRKASEVISTYVYKIGIYQADYSYATAIGLFEALISLIIVVGVNKLAQRISDSTLW